MNPFLEHIKKVLGIVDDEFDLELLNYLNGLASVLESLGVAEFINFVFYKETAFPDFSTKVPLGNLCQSYFISGTKLLFDPPANASILSAYETNKLEYESRIHFMISDMEEVI